MDETLETELQKAGRQLRANHDDETIEAVINSVEQLDSEDSEKTADILRTMVTE